MKILFLISSLRAGGAERVAVTLCNFWAQQGNQVTVLTMDSASNDFYALQPNIKRYALSAFCVDRNPIKKAYVNLAQISKIRRIIQQERPDVVTSFMAMSNMQAILACLGCKIPVIVSERTYPPYYHHRNLFDFIRKKLYRLSAAFVAQTNNVAAWAKEFLPQQKISVIANPIDPKTLAQVTPKARENILIAVGRLCADKGFDLLISAFAQIKNDFPEWKLQIFGEGPDRPSLQNLIDSKTLNSSITLMGQTMQLAEQYARGKIFVLSSRVEGFPNALVEAMAHGMAAISFACNSGPADIIVHGENGLLVTPLQTSELALALARLMQDHELQNKLSTAALEVRETYKLERIANAWIKLFESCIL